MVLRYTQKIMSGLVWILFILTFLAGDGFQVWRNDKRRSCKHSHTEGERGDTILDDKYCKKMTPTLDLSIPSRNIVGFNLFFFFFFSPSFTLYFTFFFVLANMCVFFRIRVSFFQSPDDKEFILGLISIYFSPFMNKIVIKKSKTNFLIWAMGLKMDCLVQAYLNRFLFIYY